MKRREWIGDEVSYKYHGDVRTGTIILACSDIAIHDFWIEASGLHPRHQICAAWIFKIYTSKRISIDIINLRKI